MWVQKNVSALKIDCTLEVRRSESEMSSMQMFGSFADLRQFLQNHKIKGLQPRIIWGAKA